MSEVNLPALIVTVKDKPIIYDAQGRAVTLRKPLGFAAHPAVLKKETR